MLRAALAYTRAGIPVFPLQPRGKLPLISKRQGGRGFYDATTEEAQIGVWWGKWAQANIGAPTGSASGYYVLDMDPRHEGEKSLNALLSEYGRASWPHADDERNTAFTGGGGRHYLFRSPVEIPTRNNLAPGLDFRGEGAYIVVAPSLHQSGERYEWCQGIPDPADLSPIPDWLVDLVMAAREPESLDVDVAAFHNPLPNRVTGDAGEYWLSRALVRSGDGTGDDTGWWLAVQLLVNGVADPHGVLLQYATAATRNPHDPFDERSVARWLASARSSKIVQRGEPARSQTARSNVTPIRRRAQDVEEDEDEQGNEPAEPAPTSSEHRTDLGNARRFVTRHGRNVRYVASWGAWLIWDGMRWRRDDTDEAMRKAKETVGGIYAEAGNAEDENERRELAKWAMRSEGEARLRAMLALAESEPEVAIAAEQLDAKRWLLNCRNGMVDLRTGRLLPHDRAALCSKLANVCYDSAATCDTWDRFLDTVFAGDAELIAYVQRAVGYALTCEVSEQCVFVLHGTGANGKTTFIEALTRVLGDYAMTTPTETLMVKNGQTIPSDVARLVGARFVAASESGDGRRLDEELVKRISGGDRMSARFMHRDWFDFWPTFKLFLAVNHKPTIRGTDNGIWRRIQLWPFSVTISKPDKQLPKKLLAEASGILAWAVRGCLEWQRQGLNPPVTVLAATQEYRADMDVFGRFLDECCVRKPTAIAHARALKAAYDAWCEETGEYKQSQHRLGKYLDEQGFKKGRDGRGATIWIGFGITLSEPSEPSEGLFGISHTDLPSRGEIIKKGSEPSEGSEIIYEETDE